MSERDVFNELNGVDVSGHTETKKVKGKTKSGQEYTVELTYLSWAWAWAEVKKRFPKAFYTIYENANGWFYHTDGKTCWVKTGVTIEGLEHIEYLPVMDNRNNSISAAEVTSFDVNKAIQRSLTKAVARHGLGLYVYAGEDLPEAETVKKGTEKAKPVQEEPELITSEQREAFMTAIMESFDNKDDRNATYRKVLEDLGIASTNVMNVAQFEKAMALVKKYAEGKRG